MKTPKLIIGALVSGRVKLTPEVMNVLRRHGQDEADGHAEDMPPAIGHLPAHQHGQHNDETENGGTSRPCETPASHSDVSPVPRGEADSGRLGEASLPGTSQVPQALPVSSKPKCFRRRRMVFASPLPGRWIRICGLALSCMALWLSVPQITRGQEADFDAANRAFAQGKWAEAARGFEGVISRNGYSAPALFNLANAQVHEGKLGPAILNYERARWLAPNDPDVAANLKLARQKAGLEPEANSPLRAVANSMTCTAWSILGAGMLWLIMLALPLRQVLPRARSALTAAAVLGVLVFLGAIGALVLRWPDLHRAVVVAPEVPARLSPVTVVQPSFNLRAGEAVTVKRAHGTFLLIANQQGREGWVSREVVVPIVNSGRPG
jgi:hypothetical protein